MGNFTGGLGSQMAVAAEAAYGTYKAPNRFLEYTSESLNLSRSFVMSQGLRAGRMYQSSSRRTATTRSAAGTTGLEVPSAAFGPILNLLHGETVAPVKIGAGIAYKQVHKIGTTDPYQKSLTVQIGKPNTAGTVEPFSYAGSVLTQLEFSLQTGGTLESTQTWDCRNEVTSEALVAAAYPTGLESFNHTQAKVLVNGVEQKEIRGITITINGPKDTGRYYLGAELKAQPLTNAYNGASMSLTQDYGSNTLYNFFAKAEVKKVEVTFLGNTVISEANKPELKFVAEACGFDGDSPNVSGPGPLGQTIPVVVLDDGTHPPIEATYVSGDTEL